MRSRGGICRDSPRSWNAGRRGVEGLSIEVSSFDRLSGSRNFGDGDRTGGLPSESDLAFDGDRDGLFPPETFLSSSVENLGGSFNWVLNIFAVFLL